MADLTSKQRLSLEIKDAADFEIDRDGDLCIEFENKGQTCRTWLTRPEADKLKDWLNEVLIAYDHLAKLAYEQHVREENDALEDKARG